MQIQTIMDKIIKSLDNKDTEQDTQQQPNAPSAVSILEAIFAEIMQFSNKYRKAHKKSNPQEIIRQKQEHINELKMRGDTAQNTPDIAAMQEKINEEKHRIKTNRASKRMVDLTMNEDKPTSSFLGGERTTKSKPGSQKLPKMERP